MSLPQLAAATHTSRRRISPWLTGSLLVILALAIRWLWASQPRSVRWDEADLLLLANNLLHGAGYQIFAMPELNWPPGGPAVAAVAMALGAPAEQALAISHALAGALATGLLYGLSRELTGAERIAVLAGLLLALAPALAVAPLYWGSMTESLFIAALLTGLWATWRWLRSPGLGVWRAALAAGLAYGASFLVRPEGLGWWALFLAAAGLLALWQRLAPPRDRPPRPAGRQLALAQPDGLRPGLPTDSGPLLALPLSEQRLRCAQRQNGNHRAAGARHQPNKAARWATTWDPSWTAAARRSFGSHWSASSTAFQTARERALIAIAGRLLRNLRQIPAILINDLVGLGVLALTALGIFAQPWDRRRLGAEAFTVASLLPLLVVPLFYVQDRLLAPAVPLLLIWAGRGLDGLLRWVEGTLAAWPRTRRLTPAVSALLLVALLASSLWQQQTIWQTGTASQFPSHEVAGQWLAQHSQPGEAVMTRNSEIGLYADRPLVALPDATWEQVLAYGQARDARYLVVDSWELATVRPQLSFLMQLAAAPAALELLAEFPDQRRVTCIYRLRD